LSNIVIALCFGLLIRFGLGSPVFLSLAAAVVLVNLVLAVFNLVPIPPLDGSKLLFALAPQDGRFRAFYERSSFALLIIFIFFLWQYLAPVALALFSLITGFAA
jgi:Zn-dependent protease